MQNILMVLSIIIVVGWVGICIKHSSSLPDGPMVQQRQLNPIIQILLMSEQQQQQQQQQHTLAATTATVSIRRKQQRLQTNYDNTNDEEQKEIQPTQIFEFPSGFDSVFERALDNQKKCKNLQDPKEFQGFDMRHELPFLNDTLASLPSFGVLDAFRQYYDTTKPPTDNWPICEVPPDTECQETQFTVIFMAYNPDRLEKTFRQIKKMLLREAFSGMVKEIVLVWNGQRHVDESDVGREMLEFANTNINARLRIVYPLKLGYPNDLMNRYHPDIVQVTTKAILYYDDDGPFYRTNAIEAGFELWKRHASAQIGAMAREISYSPRQRDEWNSITNNGEALTDRAFVSHCTNQNNQNDDNNSNNNNDNNDTNTNKSSEFVMDQVDYNFRYFANYNANMVLPSGSFLHSNYLCFLWHPVFGEIRQFVLDHPVHPDDMTVSMIVSQLSGRAPKVYSRILEQEKEQQSQNEDETNKESEKSVETKRRRKLMDENKNTAEKYLEMDEDDTNENEEEERENDDDEEEALQMQGVIPFSEIHRSLMFKINWDAGAGMNEMKQYWADLRTEAVNSLVRYFGSLNSGSIGWCEGTSYFEPNKKDGKCKPIMARQGWLPWMNPDGTRKDTCP